MILLSPGLCVAQDTLFNPGLRLGVDLSGLVRNYMEPEAMSWEASAGMEWSRNWFAAIEGGGTHIDIQRQTHNYRANGFFIRTGIDYNLIDRPDMAGVGSVYALARYGIGRINHEAPGVIISNTYWGDYQTAVPAESAYAHWFETGGGLRTKLIGNFFAGWTIRARFPLFLKETQGMEPYYISGFGKNSGRPVVMLHFSLYYQF